MSDRVSTRKIRADELRTADRIPVTRIAPHVRLDGSYGLSPEDYATATVSAVERRPGTTVTGDFIYVTTDQHAGPLAFLGCELVSILPR